jgi:hypothetical protein
LDGAGFKIQEVSTIHYAPTCGITVYSNQVTIKNVIIKEHGPVTVYGDYNTLSKISFDKGAKILGSHNEIIEGVFPDAYLIVEGNYNSIKGNTLQGKALIMGGNFNTATENTIEDCTDFAVKPSNGTNWFYLNNFINNTYISKTLPVPSAANWAILPQPHIAPFKWQSIPNGWEAIYPDNLIFDNGTFGNYYSDYTGKDDNNDGVGDTPYFIGGTLQDNYPLIEPSKRKYTGYISTDTRRTTRNSATHNMSNNSKLKNKNHRQ